MDRSLTETAFELLLQRLDPDRDVAASKLLAMERRLRQLFEKRGFPDPDRLVDETVDRVAHRIAVDGVEIENPDVYVYFQGVASRVAKETRRKYGKEIQYSGELPVGPARDEREQTEAEVEERRNECLKECLDRMPVKQRRLILKFYRGEKGRRIKNRAELAEQEGISPGNLRVKAHRIREKLLDCVRECMKRKSGSG